MIDNYVSGSKSETSNFGDEFSDEGSELRTVRKKILIVEDDPGTAALQQRRLLRAGFIVVVATDPAEAIEIIENENIGLVVLDYRLADNRTGLEFYQHLKSRGLHPPTIMVTGFSNEALVVQALRAGVRDFVAKSPDYLDYLPHAIRQVLEKVETERRLVESESRKAAVLESSLDAIVTIDEQGRIVEVNPAFEQTFGFSMFDVVGRDLAELIVPPSLRARHHRGLKRFLDTGEAHILGKRVELPAIRSDGSEFLAEVSISLSTVDRRKLFTAHLRDLTDQKKAEAATHQLAAIVESSTDAIIGEALDGTVVSWNKGAESLFGYTAAEMIGQSISIMFPPHRSEDSSQIIEELRRGERVEPFESVRIRKDGKRIDVSLSSSPIQDKFGRIVGVAKIIRDITERKRFETRLRLRDRALEEVQEGIIFSDPRKPDNPIVYVNPAFERISGYKAADLIGKNCRVLQGKDSDPATVAEMRKAIREYRACNVEILNYRADGTTFWNKVSITPLHDDDGHITHFVGVTSDVSQRRVMEEQLRQSHKMEAIGRLAGGIAHDFNNILTVILGSTEFALYELPPEHSALREHLQIITEAGNRAAALTYQLLAFSRKQVLAPRALDINVLTKNLDKLLRRLIGEDIELVTTLGNELGEIKADPSQIEQIVMNLVANARDAMPDGGTLFLETSNTELDSLYAERHPDIEAGNYVKLSVSDTGCGMTPEVLSQAFEPFFTTKPAGQGTGMGLATVFGIVKQSGGHIQAYSEPGQGTTFNVYFPRLQGGVVVADSSSVSTRSSQGNETILLVEDEPLVRSLANQILRAAGFTVLEASEGQEALDVAARHPETIHMVVSDVIMPVMNGPQLVEQLVKLRPAIKVLFISGYPNDAIVHRGILAAGTAFLQKPFTKNSLTQKIRQILDK